MFLCMSRHLPDTVIKRNFKRVNRWGFANTAECWTQCSSGLHTWTRTKVHSLMCTSCCLYSVTAGEWVFVVYVCVRGDLDQKATVLNMRNKCSVWVFLPTWLHAGVITPWILLSAQPSLHLFKCSHSSHSLFAKWRQKRNKKKLSTHNHHGGCQILCLLYKFCLTVQSFFKNGCGLWNHKYRVQRRTWAKDLPKNASEA